ncbi:MAG: protein kinase [Planctomycetota bacterium]|nr:protein kinase [Planctomycetota bacterium]
MRLKIKNWELVGEIARGRWSTVYSARPLTGLCRNTDYVIKFVDPDSAGFDVAVEMLRREFACSRLISDAGIISFLDHDLDAEMPFLVSGKMDGDSLLRINKKLRCFVDFNEKVMFFRQLCQSLSSLHSLDIRHGDLSPGNILIDLENGLTKIIDLGLAVKVTPFTRNDQWQAGTFGYQAPECNALQEPVTVAADIFSLGKLMIEFFEGEKPMVIASSLPEESPRRSLLALLGRMTETNPLKRPTLSEVRLGLSELEIQSLEWSGRRAA